MIAIAMTVIANTAIITTMNIMLSEPVKEDLNGRPARVN